MSAAETNETIFFSSIFRHGIDEKRRVQIPAKWRPAQEDIQYHLILWPHGNDTQACLLVLPPAEWQALVDKLKAFPFNHPDAQRLRRILGTKSAQVDLDRSGRICIPEEMVKAVGITQEASLVGLVDRFQIWNPERYAAVAAEDEQSSGEAFKLIS